MWLRGRLIRRGCLLFLLPGIASSGPSLRAQLQFHSVPETTIQARLSSYRGNDAVRKATLKQMFTEAGCARENLTEQPVPQTTQPNLICTLHGTTDEIIVVGAHFDHVEQGSGVVDNWSGASLLPSLYQGLATTQPKYTYWFVGFAGEEQGEVGSKYLVKQLGANQLGKIRAMVNLDTLGLGPSEVWSSQSDPYLVSLLLRTARALSLPLTAMNVDGFGISDEESFIRRRVCTVMVHSITNATTHVLHSPADNLKAIRLPDYYETYRLLAAYLAVLDSSTLPADRPCPTRALE